MKKSLLALAVLGAFAGAASAQSSVTLFGVVDLNLQYINNNGTKQYTMGQDGLNSSRLGFRGTEDLGGGLSAGFWIEGAINPDIGTATGQTWQRRSTVSLAGGWGEVRLGRDYTSTFWNSTIFDPFGTNGVGSAGNLAFAVPPIPSGGAFNTLVRANNMVGYFLPSGIAGGLYGQVQVAAGENTPGNKYFGGRIGYAAGPFNVAGAWGKTQATIVATPNVPGDQDMTAYNFGASWNFGFMQLSGYYGRLELANNDQNNWYIGAQAPLGVWTFKASYGQVDRSGPAIVPTFVEAGGVITPATTPWEGQKANMLAIGATYDLSKRTALYGTWAGINNKDGARLCVGALQNFGASGGCVGNENSQGLQLGIKHSF
jgi:predicted porin